MFFLFQRLYKAISRDAIIFHLSWTPLFWSYPRWRLNSCSLSNNNCNPSGVSLNNTASLAKRIRYSDNWSNVIPASAFSWRDFSISLMKKTNNSGEQVSPCFLILFIISTHEMGTSNSGNVGVSGWELSKSFRKSLTSPCDFSLTSEASILKCSSNSCNVTDPLVGAFFCLNNFEKSVSDPDLPLWHWMFTALHNSNKYSPKRFDVQSIEFRGAIVPVTHLNSRSIQHYFLYNHIFSQCGYLNLQVLKKCYISLCFVKSRVLSYSFENVNIIYEMVVRILRGYICNS